MTKMEINKPVSVFYSQIIHYRLQYKYVYTDEKEIKCFCMPCYVVLHDLSTDVQNVNATAFKNKDQVLPPYISLTFVNVVAMAPGYLLNAQCTFAKIIIRSISQRAAKTA